MRPRTLFGLGLAAALASRPLHAQTLGPQVLVVQGDEQTAMNTPDVCSHAAGDFVVTWITSPSGSPAPLRPPFAPSASPWRTARGQADRGQRHLIPTRSRPPALASDVWPPVGSSPPGSPTSVARKPCTPAASTPPALRWAPRSPSTASLPASPYGSVLTVNPVDKFLVAWSLNLPPDAPHEPCRGRVMLLGFTCFRTPRTSPAAAASCSSASTPVAPPPARTPPSDATPSAPPACPPSATTPSASPPSPGSQPDRRGAPQFLDPPLLGRRRASWRRPARPGERLLTAP